MRQVGPIIVLCVLINLIFGFDVLAAEANKQLLIWQVNPWDLPEKDVLPTSGQHLDTPIEITAFQSEFVTIAIGLANPTTVPLELRCETTDLVTFDFFGYRPKLSHLSLHKVVSVGLRKGGTHRDALPRLRVEDVFYVLPKSNEVVWLTIDTHDLPAGVWRASLRMGPVAEHQEARNVRITLKVLPSALPQGSLPYSCNWGQYYYPPAMFYPESCYKDQKAHYTNVHIVPFTYCGIEKLRFDEKGKPLCDPNFSDLDRFIQHFGTTNQFYIMQTYYRILPRWLGGGGNLGEQEKANFAWYVTKVRRFFEQKKMTVRDFAWYVTDEPRKDEIMDIVNFGKLLHASDGEQQAFTTWLQRKNEKESDNMESIRTVAPYVDIWMPHITNTPKDHHVTPKDQLDLIFSQKARFFSYSVLQCGSKPYRDYRCMATLALKYGCEGIGFWNYDDSGDDLISSTSWDDTDGRRADYAVIYEGSDGPVPSVRWEAWRQGIQDYRYIKWLDELAAKSGKPEITDKVKSLVSEAIKEILENNATTTADSYMDQVREMIVRLLDAERQVAPEKPEKLFPQEKVCLTGNDGRYFSNMDTGGYYTYSDYYPLSTCGERSGVTKGPVYFKGMNAKEQPQSKNKRDGNLTDSNLEFTYGWVRGEKPGRWSIVFDLNGTFMLSDALFYGFIFSYPILPVPSEIDELTVFVSLSGKEEDWVRTDQLKNISAITGTVFDHSVHVELDNKIGRYVRFDVTTSSENPSSIGEICIYGWYAN